jgi:hypothetical protein
MCQHGGGLSARRTRRELPGGTCDCGGGAGIVAAHASTRNRAEPVAKLSPGVCVAHCCSGARVLRE